MTKHIIEKQESSAVVDTSSQTKTTDLVYLDPEGNILTQTNPTVQILKDLGLQVNISIPNT